MRAWIKEWWPGLAIIAAFAAIMADGLHNESKFSDQCSRLGGIVTGYHNVCVKPGSILIPFK